MYAQYSFEQDRSLQLGCYCCDTMTETASQEYRLSISSFPFEGSERFAKPKRIAYRLSILQLVEAVSDLDIGGTNSYFLEY